MPEDGPHEVAVREHGDVLLGAESQPEEQVVDPGEEVVEGFCPWPVALVRVVTVPVSLELWVSLGWGRSLVLPRRELRPLMNVPDLAGDVRELLHQGLRRIEGPDEGGPHDEGRGSVPILG